MLKRFGVQGGAIGAPRNFALGLGHASVRSRTTASKPVSLLNVAQPGKFIDAP